jgi:GNAT superfamily N-acetyltransferase
MSSSLKNNVQLSGYVPGTIGRITALHATYYHNHWGFDVSFEAQVARELSEFMRRFRKGEDCLWVASVEGRFAGSIGIDGHRAQIEGARLRWFIVSPEFQDHGIGTLLFRKAMDFCKESGHRRVYLWTFEGLDAARRMYERGSFRLCEEHDVEQWGTKLKEQKFEMNL